MNLMKKYFLPLAVLLLILTFSCSNKKEQSTEVVVYGSSKCHHCTDFMKQLDSADITYEFKDLIIEEKEYDKEMLDKIEKSGYRGYVSLPVIEVEGEIFIRPKISEITPLVK